MKAMRYINGLNKGLFRLVSLALLLALVVTGAGTGIAQANPDWYDTNWQYRKKITIDQTKVTADLTNFPVLINLSSDSDLASDAQDDGDDILFTASDEITKLSHEIEKFDGSTGELVAWVKVPSLSSSTNTDIYMYYGNASASNQENATGVWDSNYVAVWHLSEDPSGTTPQMLDSTSNNHDGTTEGSWTSSDQVSGLIDGSLDFNSGIDKVKVGTFDVVAGGSGNDGITLEAWAYSDDHRDGRFISKADGTSDSNHWWMLNALDGEGSSRLRFRLKLDGTTHVLLASAGTFPTGQWVYVAATYDGSNMRIYQDASQMAITAKSGTISTDSSKQVAIGNQPPGAGDRRYDGRITEVRVSNIARSADWIQTQYNNQNSPSTFYSLGSEETPPVGAPTVTNSTGESNVTTTSARLNGEVTNTGGENPTVHIYWGDNDGGTTPGNWDNDENLGTKGLGTFYKNVSGLTASTTYYYRCYATNSAGSDWANSTASFTTSAGVPPTEVGGTIYPINKGAVLAPWIALVLILSLAMASGTRRLRRCRVKVGDKQL